MVAAGLCATPLGLTMPPTAPAYARIPRRYGPRAALPTGRAVPAVGHGAGTVPMRAVRPTVRVPVVIGPGVGFAYSALPAPVTSAVDPPGPAPPMGRTR